MKPTYVVLCVAGFVAPYCFFVSFLLARGLDLPLFFAQLTASPASLFFAADVLVSALGLWAFVYFETRRRPIRLWWLAIVATLAVGVSLALPLFLLVRENAIERERTV